MSAPPPPYSSGTGSPWMPNSAHFFQWLLENSSSSSRRMRSSFNSCWAKRMTSLRNAACSSVHAKSKSAFPRLCRLRAEILPLRLRLGLRFQLCFDSVGHRAARGCAVAVRLGAVRLYSTRLYGIRLHPTCLWEIRLGVVLAGFISSDFVLPGFHGFPGHLSKPAAGQFDPRRHAHDGCIIRHIGQNHAVGDHQHVISDLYLANDFAARPKVAVVANALYSRADQHLGIEGASRADDRRCDLQSVGSVQNHPGANFR